MDGHNTRLGVLLVILRTWSVDSSSERDPTMRIKGFSGHKTYSREQPNALTPQEVGAFCGAMRTMHSRHYTLVVLGISTGFRTCTLRALRVRDVLWEEGDVLNRRSHTRSSRHVIIERTKTGKEVDVAVPAEVLALLHTQASDKEADDLLFPGAGPRTPQDGTSLIRAFRSVASAIGLKKRLTPHSMRRTNKDLLRAAGASQAVSMAISGHLTEAMHLHYSTVSTDEQRAAISRALALGGVLGGASGRAADGGPTETGTKARTLFRHLPTISSTSSGIVAACARSGGGASFITLIRMLTTVSSANGGRPASTSYIVAPRL